MRLMNTTTCSLTDDSNPEFIANPQYAIFSHRWSGNETTFQDHDPAKLRTVDSKTGRFTPQAWKIRGACAQARVDGLRWLWVDTCCINKDSSSELSEAINSMFRYYRGVKVCYVYLHDVTRASGFRVAGSENSGRRPRYSEWFSRGWTLQELLAPKVLAFFDRDWYCIGSKFNLAGKIEHITGIDSAYLTAKKTMRDACIATKMSWMAGRTTTRIEDMAYSLLGLFDINLTPVYGEREKSFLRLQRALMEQSTDESLFAWKASKHNLPIAMDDSQCKRGDWGLLAPSPQCFRDCGALTIKGKDKSSRRAEGGLSWTQQGIRMPIPSADAWEYNSIFDQRNNLRKVQFTLNCWRPNVRGELRTIRIFLSRRFPESGV